MVEYFLASIAGYSTGRLGHIIGGSISWLPHHWILGILLMLVPVFFKKISRSVKILIILFAVGLFISDFNDFIAFKTFGSDDVKLIKFWGID